MARGLTDLAQDERGGLRVFTDSQGRTDLAVVDGTEQVAQDIRSRLMTWRGEWFLDVRAGYPYRQLADTRPASAVVAAGEARTIVLETPGVLRIKAGTYRFALSNSRVLSVAMTAVTPWEPVPIVIESFDSATTIWVRGVPSHMGSASLAMV